MSAIETLTLQHDGLTFSARAAGEGRWC